MADLVDSIGENSVIDFEHSGFYNFSRKLLIADAFIGSRRANLPDDHLNDLLGFIFVVQPIGKIIEVKI